MPKADLTLKALVAEAFASAAENGHYFTTWSDYEIANDMRDCHSEIAEWPSKAVAEAVAAYRKEQLK